MKVLDRTINAWQAGIILFMLLLANKILVLPSLLFEGAKMESIFILIFFFFLELCLLLLFFKLKAKYPTESFAEILQSHFGKVVRVIVFLCFMIFFLSKAVLLYNITYIFFRNLIYKDTSNLLILFCFLPVINHLAICGLRVFGRTAQLFFPIVFVILIFCLIVGVFGIDSRAIWFQTPFLEIVKTSAIHIEPFGDTIFLFLIMDRVKVKKGDSKVIFYLFAISAVMVIAVNLVFMLSYTYTTFMHPYAIFEIISFVKEFGGMGRIDVVSMVVIIILAYFHLATYLKAFMFSFDGVFPKANKVYSVITFNFLFVVIVTFFIVNLETAVNFGEQILPYITIFPFVVLPVLVLILFLWKRKNKVEKKPKNTGKMFKKFEIGKKDLFSDTNEKDSQQKTAKQPENAVFLQNDELKNVENEPSETQREEKDKQIEVQKLKKILKKPQKVAFFAKSSFIDFKKVIL